MAAAYDVSGWISAELRADGTRADAGARQCPTPDDTSAPGNEDDRGQHHDRHAQGGEDEWIDAQQAVAGYGDVAAGAVVALLPIDGAAVGVAVAVGTGVGDAVGMGVGVASGSPVRGSTIV